MLGTIICVNKLTIWERSRHMISKRRELRAVLDDGNRTAARRHFLQIFIYHTAHFYIYITTKFSARKQKTKTWKAPESIIWGVPKVLFLPLKGTLELQNILLKNDWYKVVSWKLVSLFSEFDLRILLKRFSQIQMINLTSKEERLASRQRDIL